MPQPVLKWPGGKRRIVKKLVERLPATLPDIVCEPFFGGGAFSLAIEAGSFVVSDISEPLMTTYRVIRDEPEPLIEMLSGFADTPEEYARIRAMDRDPGFSDLPALVRAARMLYLNRTCFNGLWRVNAKGWFNVPRGSYGKHDIVNAKGIRELSRWLNGPKVFLFQEDFEKILGMLPRGSFAYLDPPYDETFQSYTAGGFGEDGQERLAKTVHAFSARGGKFMLSSSDTPLVRRLYSRFRISSIRAPRSIGAKTRRPADELIITNY